MQASTKDLRLHTQELLAATERGEEVVITYRGRKCAKLVPLDEAVPESGRGRNPAFGLWRDREELEVERHVRELRKGRPLP